MAALELCYENKILFGKVMDSLEVQTLVSTKKTLSDPGYLDKHVVKNH